MNSSVKRGLSSGLKLNAMCPTGFLIPVSYTHLDVYKRQGDNIDRLKDYLVQNGIGNYKLAFGLYGATRGLSLIHISTNQLPSAPWAVMLYASPYTNSSPLWLVIVNLISVVPNG